MERRSFLRGLVLLGICPICANVASAAEGVHWTYEGEHGPDHWGSMDKANIACSAGSQQSPLDIVGTIKADIPAIKPDWKAGGAKIANNGHTIQINVAEGSKLARGDRTYDLLQYHFHSPSEHRVDGKAFPMEAHFVHKNAATGGLGVIGVFLTPGKTNASFAAVAAAFPDHESEGEEGGLPDSDPAGMPPASLDYWYYEGSLTTPPCSETVDWMVVKAPLEVAEADIAKYTKLYSHNARPVLPSDRRFILSSS